MYKRYYDGYPMEAYRPDEGETIIPDNTYHSASADEDAQSADESTVSTELAVGGEDSGEIHAETASNRKRGLFSSFKSDDGILIALLIILATESPDDIIMPLIIGYLLLGDFLPI